MPRDKYEDEIRDILNKMDDFIPEERHRPKPRKPASPPLLNRWAANLRRQLYTSNSMSLLAGTVIFALAAGLLHRIYPPFGMLAALASVGCLLLAIAVPMVSRRYGQPEKRWRGKVVDYEPYRFRREGASWKYLWWRIKSLFRMR